MHKCSKCATLKPLEEFPYGIIDNRLQIRKPKVCTECLVLKLKKTVKNANNYKRKRVLTVQEEIDLLLDTMLLEDLISN